MKTKALRIEFEEKLKALGPLFEVKDYTKIAAIADVHPTTIPKYFFGIVADLETAEAIIEGAEAVLKNKPVTA